MINIFDNLKHFSFYKLYLFEIFGIFDNFIVFRLKEQKEFSF